MPEERDFVDQYAAVVGGRLRGARDRLGVDQVELAERLGISQGQLSRWERGVHLPRDYWRARLAFELDTAFADLFPPMAPVAGVA